MTTGVGATHSSATENSKPATPSVPAGVESKETFLKLLVAQIKNQNPMQPADGLQFLSELSQFSQLEQLMEMGKDLTAIRDSLAPVAADSNKT